MQLYDFISLTFPADRMIAITVSGDVAPMVDAALILACNVVGADMITNPTIIYQWSRNGMVVTDQTQRTWSFSSLAYSDAGQYSCAVDISSTILPSTISAVSDSFNVTLSCKSYCSHIAGILVRILRIIDKICL